MSISSDEDYAFKKAYIYVYVDSIDPESFWLWIGLLERNNPSEAVVIQADRCNFTSISHC